MPQFFWAQRFRGPAVTVVPTPSLIICSVCWPLKLSCQGLNLYMLSFLWYLTGNYKLASIWWRTSFELLSSWGSIGTSCAGFHPHSLLTLNWIVELDWEITDVYLSGIECWWWCSWIRATRRRHGWNSSSQCPSFSSIHECNVGCKRNGLYGVQVCYPFYLPYTTKVCHVLIYLKLLGFPFEFLRTLIC